MHWGRQGSLYVDVTAGRATCNADTGAVRRVDLRDRYCTATILRGRKAARRQRIAQRLNTDPGRRATRGRPDSTRRLAVNSSTPWAELVTFTELSNSVPNTFKSLTTSVKEA